MSDSDDSRSGIYHRDLDTDQGDLEIQVVQTIAALEDTESFELAPIHNAIDDLLSGLVSPPPSPDSQAKLEFCYEGYRITVHHDGTATFAELPAEPTE